MFEKLKKPFVIAEMSGNHNQSLDRAIKIIEAAAEAGVDAVKLQTYTADTMTIDKNDGEFFINSPKSLWHGQSLYELYQKAYTPWEWHEALFRRGKELGLMVFSSPFDASAVEFLEKLGTPCYKVASFELTDLLLVEKMAKTKKPMLLSTGMATASEIDKAVRIARQFGCPDVCLLKCTSVYPAEARDSNLLTIPHMKQLFNCQIGLSDHTPGVGVSVASVALGGMVIEKHFTLDRASGGVDAAFSLEPQEMKQLVTDANRAYEALGEIYYGLTAQESALGRRSLYVVHDMKQGESFTTENVRAIRPGYGLATEYLPIVLGRTAVQDISKGTPLQWNLF